MKMKIKNFQCLNRFKQMKKIFLLWVLIILSLILSVNAAILSGSTYITVTLLSQDPDPISPGRWVDLRWKIENIGRDNADDFQFEVILENPFSLYSGELTRDLGTIAGRQIDEEGVIVHYRLKVDESAVEGTNKIKVRYKWGTYEWVTSEEFDIRIQSVDATLSIEGVKVEPEAIVPGEKAKISVNIKNLADSTMNDISFKLDLSSATLPLAPIGSATEKKVKLMAAGEETELVFDVIAEPDAELGVYKIPVEIIYYDELETKYNKSDTIAVIVGAKPDLSIFLDSTDIIRAGTMGEVTVKFVNKGVGDIKFLDVTLGLRDDYELLSSENVYLGNVDSDDYETADYDLWINPTKEKELILPLHIEYKDANNNDYTFNKEIKLKLYTAKEAQKMGLVTKSNTLGIIIFIVIVVGGIIAYRIIRKKKKKK